MDSRQTIRNLVMSMVDKDAQHEPMKETELKMELDRIVGECEGLAMEIEAGEYSMSLAEQKDLHDSYDPRV